MKEILTYVAEDGTHFDAKEDCLEYEATIIKKPIMLDFDGDETLDYDFAYCLIIKNDNEMEWALNAMLNDKALSKVFRNDLIVTGLDRGIWVYDECTETYRLVCDKDIEILQKSYQIYHQK